MVFGMMVSGVMAGFAGAIWALFHELPLLLVLVFYMAVGIIGACAFLGFALLRPCRKADAPSMTFPSKISVRNNQCP